MARILRRLLFLVAAIVGVVAVTAPSYASFVTYSPTYCAAVISKSGPNGQVSRVIRKQCSTDRADLASIELAGTRLIRVYVNANYAGCPASSPNPAFCTDILGNDGPCDAAGYRIANIDGILPSNWGYLISAFQTFGNCFRVTGYWNVDYGEPHQDYLGNTPYVGDTLNDHFLSAHLAAA
ncbi:hypothetical protein [Fodinicola acaciae]|uniref:hypothetical protein n=1 Tax=Fodinicola acaciae TaxID=2681555 RepID=UPI0013D2C98C|nr:hypothetical protein [Fodinicola acaciae]